MYGFFFFFLLVLLDMFSTLSLLLLLSKQKKKATTKIIKRFRITICTRWHDDKARIVAALSVRNAEKKHSLPKEYKCFIVHWEQLRSLARLRSYLIKSLDKQWPCEAGRNRSFLKQCNQHYHKILRIIFNNWNRWRTKYTTRRYGR